MMMMTSVRCITCSNTVKILSLLEIAINYLRNKSNISRHFDKPRCMHYREKHKSLTMLQLLYQFLTTKLC